MIKVTTHNKKKINAAGTSLQALTFATYDTLVRVLGQPLMGDGDRTRAEWRVEFKMPGHLPIVATIYDWKKHDTAVTQVTTWNIGGKSRLAADLVDKLLREKE